MCFLCVCFFWVGSFLLHVFLTKKEQLEKVPVGCFWCFGVSIVCLLLLLLYFLWSVLPFVSGLF